MKPWKHLTTPLLATVFACASGGSASGPGPEATPAPSAAPSPAAKPSASGGKALEEAKKLARDGKLPEARAAAEKVAAESPNVEEAHLLAASIASMAGDAAGAKAAIERGLAALPQSAQLHHEYGMNALEANQMPLAVKELEESLKLFGPRRGADVLADLAYAYLFVDRLDDAEKLAGEARGIDPKLYAPAFTHGEALLRLKRFPEAAKAYQAAAALQPDDPLPRTRLAAALMKAKDFAGAVPVLESVQKTASAEEKPSLLAALAQCYLETGRPKDAVATAKQASELNPSDPNLLSLLADAEEAAGDKAAAKKTRAKIPSGGKKK